MEKFLIDCNIFDLLQSDHSTVGRIRSLIIRGKVKMLVTRTVAEELYNSPFKGIPSFFPMEYTGNTVGRCGIMACGDSLGDGSMFYRHLGTSSKINDAFIADAALCRANWLVSQDVRLRLRFNRTSTMCKAVCYETFKGLLAQNSS